MMGELIERLKGVDERIDLKGYPKCPSRGGKSNKAFRFS